MGVLQLLRMGWLSALLRLPWHGWVKDVCPTTMALVGTNIHISCKYREEGDKEGFRGIKILGMECSWAEQVGEAVLIPNPPVFVCTALGCPARGTRQSIGVSLEKSARSIFMAFLQGDCFRDPLL